MTDPKLIDLPDRDAADGVARLNALISEAGTGALVCRTLETQGITIDEKRLSESLRRKPSGPDDHEARNIVRACATLLDRKFDELWLATFPSGSPFVQSGSASRAASSNAVVPLESVGGARQGIGQVQALLDEGHADLAAQAVFGLAEEEWVAAVVMVAEKSPADAAMIIHEGGRHGLIDHRLFRAGLRQNLSAKGWDHLDEVFAALPVLPEPTPVEAPAALLPPVAVSESRRRVALIQNGKARIVAAEVHALTRGHRDPGARTRGVHRSRSQRAEVVSPLVALGQEGGWGRVGVVMRELQVIDNDGFKAILTDLCPFLTAEAFDDLADLVPTEVLVREFAAATDPAIWVTMGSRTLGRLTRSWASVGQQFPVPALEDRPRFARVIAGIAGCDPHRAALALVAAFTGASPDHRAMMGVDRKLVDIERSRAVVAAFQELCLSDSQIASSVLVHLLARAPADEVARMLCLDVDGHRSAMRLVTVVVDALREGGDGALFDFILVASTPLIPADVLDLLEHQHSPTARVLIHLWAQRDRAALEEAVALLEGGNPVSPFAAAIKEVLENRDATGAEAVAN